MSIDSKNPVKDDSEESVGSSPEGEPGPANNTTQENQQPKRKGGRKPVSFSRPPTPVVGGQLFTWLACIPSRDDLGTPYMTQL